MSSTKTQAAAKRVNASINDMRTALAKDIAKTIDELGLTQTEAAFMMHDAPSQVSLVVTGKLRGFSLVRLIRMRALLGAEITLNVKVNPTPKVALKVA